MLEERNENGSSQTEGKPILYSRLQQAELWVTKTNTICYDASSWYPSNVQRLSKTIRKTRRDGGGCEERIKLIYPLALLLDGMVSSSPSRLWRRKRLQSFVAASLLRRLANDTTLKPWIACLTNQREMHLAWRSMRWDKRWVYPLI